MRFYLCAGLAVWIIFGILAYAGQLAHSRIDIDSDQLCRRVNSAAVCDDRLVVEKSSLLILGVLGGPISFLISAATTGFFHAGFQFR